jgi:hypothetical protein
MRRTSLLDILANQAPRPARCTALALLVPDFIGAKGLDFANDESLVNAIKEHVATLTVGDESCEKVMMLALLIHNYVPNYVLGPYAGSQ